VVVGKSKTGSVLADLCLGVLGFLSLTLKFNLSSDTLSLQQNIWIFIV